MPKRLCFSLVPLFVISVVTLTACGNSSSGNTTPPPPSEYLYVANCGSSGVIAQYTLPLTSTSTPDFSLSTTGCGLALDSSGDLIAAGRNPVITGGVPSDVFIFDAPLSANMSPTITFGVPYAITPGIALDSGGDLALGGTDYVYIYNHPLTSSSTISASPNPVETANGLIFDSSGDLIVSSDESGPPPFARLLIESPPFGSAPHSPPGTTNVSGASYGQPGISGEQLYVPNSNAGTIDVFGLPLSGTSAPAFSISVTDPTVVAFDKSGNMYVGQGNGSISVFAPPFSATSVPTVTLTLTTGGSAWTIGGMAITQ